MVNFQFPELWVKKDDQLSSLAHHGERVPLKAGNHRQTADASWHVAGQVLLVHKVPSRALWTAGYH